MPTDRTSSPPPLAPAGLSALEELVHGRVPPALLHALGEALHGDPMPATPDPAGREAQVRRRLLRIAGAVPPGRELLDAPAQLGAVLAWTAASQPSMAMVLAYQYLLVLSSMKLLAPEPDLLKAHFEALESGRARGVYMITEVGQANSHLDTRTTAEFDPVTREFVIGTPDGAATKFTSGTADGGPLIAVMLARLVVGGADCGVFSFVVDLADHDGLRPGVEMSTGVELSALPLNYAQFRFHGVRLPYGHWLRDSAAIAADGTFHDPLGSPDLRLQRTLCVGQTLWAALPSGLAAMARQSAVLAVRYAAGRRTQSRLAPGRPLLAYRTQQYGVLGALAEAFALTCAASRALEVWSGTGPGRTDGSPDGEGSMTFAPWTAVSRPLSAYKAHTVRAAARVVADCQRHCGFSGHLDGNWLVAYHGFPYAFDAAGGDSQLILFDLGRALAEDAPVPAPPRVTSAPGEPGWWPAVLAAHQHRLTVRLRARRDERADGADGPDDEFARWNPLLADAGELGETYAARLVAEDLLGAVTRAGERDPDSATALAALAGLYGVAGARRLAGSLLAAGTLRPAEVQRLLVAADLLCDRLIPRLPLLEQAFAYPQSVVPSPLGMPDFTGALSDSLAWHRGGTA
ncbi:acyl-CoA dehydrogenase [Kitasatospora sp. NPDC101801]|uniref:acyl-CoA dehydrogenase family protein n=1 Tax=Kitasatospora sp. NPDC101801 TaxID=3364103 RepID=UPI0037F76C0F